MGSERRETRYVIYRILDWIAKVFKEALQEHHRFSAPHLRAEETQEEKEKEGHRYQGKTITVLSRKAALHLDDGRVIDVSGTRGKVVKDDEFISYKNTEHWRKKHE